MPPMDEFDKDTPLKAMLPNWKSIAGFIGFIAIIGFIWYSYAGSGDNKSAQIPIIYAAKTPYKIQPDNPGGLQIQNTDSTIYNVMRGTDDLEGADLNRENLAEEPVFEGGEGVVFKETDARPEEPSVENLFDVVSEKPDLPIDTKPEEIETNEPAASEEKAVESDKPDTQDIKEVINALQKPEPKPITKPVEQAVEKTIAAPVNKTISTAAGTHYIQMASFRDQNTAEQGYQNIVKKYGSDIDGLKVRYSPVTVEGKGDFIRVQLGPVSKAVADQTCATLKEKGASCYVLAN